MHTCVLAMAVVKPVDMPFGLDVLLREEVLVPLGWSTCGRLARLADVIEDFLEHCGLCPRDERDETQSPSAFALERIYLKDESEKLVPTTPALAKVKREEI